MDGLLCCWVAAGGGCLTLRAKREAGVVGDGSSLQSVRGKVKGVEAAKMWILESAVIFCAKTKLTLPLISSRNVSCYHPL